MVDIPMPTIIKGLMYMVEDKEPLVYNMINVDALPVFKGSTPSKTKDEGRKN